MAISGTARAFTRPGWWTHSPRRAGTTAGTGATRRMARYGSRALETTGENTIYTVSLPVSAPLALQADWLSAMIRSAANRHPDQPVVLVGHSAGGVVSRLSLVRGGVGPVVHLITIASPHLGTARALAGPGRHRRRWHVRPRPPDPDAAGRGWQQLRRDPEFTGSSVRSDAANPGQPSGMAERAGSPGHHLRRGRPQYRLPHGRATS
jgi:hypothetical protein